MSVQPILAEAHPQDAPEAPEANHPIRDVVRRLREGGDEAVILAARAIAPRLAARADYHDRNAIFPKQDFEDLWAAGLTLLSLPKAAGGVGASLYATAAALKIISGANASTGFVLKWHLTRFREAEARWPTALRRQLLDQILSGPTLVAGLRNEAGKGSPARGGVPATRAKTITLPGGRKAWKLNGHKTYGSGAVASRWLAVWAATDEADGDIQVGSFIVPADAPGVEILEGSWDHLGMRATASDDVILRDVVIPYDHAANLTPFGADPLAARTADPRRVDWGNVLEAALYSGIAEAARDWLLPYLNTRSPGSLGAPLATLERFQIAAGEIELLLYANAKLIGDIARRADIQAEADEPPADPVTYHQTGLVKTAVVRNAIQAVDIAVSLVGNPGLSFRHPLQRHHRDVLCGRVHEPQADVLLRIAGRAALAARNPAR